MATKSRSKKSKHIALRQTKRSARETIRRATRARGEVERATKRRQQS